MKKSIRQAWTNFARTGDPNSPKLNFTWEKFDGNTFNTLIIDEQLKTVSGIRLNDIELLYRTFAEYKENTDFAELWDINMGKKL